VIDPEQDQSYLRSSNHVLASLNLNSPH